MHEITEDEGNVVTVKVSGKLTSQDYDDLIPAWKKVIAKHGSMRMLFVMHDFHGWEPKAAWEDFTFDRAYSQKVERVAMVGEKSWQKWMSKLASLFAKADVNYFESGDLEKAERWVRAT